MSEASGRHPTILVLSPHLDDAAFSCGGAMAALARQGRRVVLATTFTASVPDPTGFALACQLDKGLGPEVDYMALRRDEDAACGRALGVDVADVVWLGLPEAPHRGYHSARELFGPTRPADPIPGPLAEAIRGLIDRFDPMLILAPQAIGGHVDHRQVVRATLVAARATGRPVGWYRDLPYAAKHPEDRPDPTLPTGLGETAISLAEADLEAKLAGCECYASQLPFQFGGPSEMRDGLGGFAAREAARLGVDGHAEALLMPEGVAWPGDDESR